MTASTPPRVFFRHQPVKCPVCGRTAKRTSLKQIYCTARCRKKAENDRAAYRRLNRLGEPQLHRSASATARREVDLKEVNDAAASKGQGIGSSMITDPIDLLGGSRRHWPNASHLEREVRRAILDAEIGPRTQGRHRPAAGTSISTTSPQAITPDAVGNTTPGADSNPPNAKQEIGSNEDTF